MKSDIDLQKDVHDAIAWDRLLSSAEIGITAKQGVITLTGIVDSFAKKTEAENITKNVVGVKAVVEKIEVKFKDDKTKDDNEIAKDVLNAFRLNWKVPDDKVKVKVEAGGVTLEGELQWNYQKEAAKNSVINLNGVKAVRNLIEIKSEIIDDIEKKDIERALRRSWAIDNQDIRVEVTGKRVVLSGTVRSLFQKDEADRIAWNAPGVWTVDNGLIVE
ncbi:MAG: BON domain-containing protein [Bacteroidota bacterium]